MLLLDHKAKALQTQRWREVEQREDNYSLTEAELIKVVCFWFYLGWNLKKEKLYCNEIENEKETAGSGWGSGSYISLGIAEKD